MPTLVIDATSENLDPMLDFIEQGVIGNSQFDRKLIKMIRLVAEEILSNIINYSYPGEKGTIEIFYEVAATSFTMEIKDHGIAFNPIKLPDPDFDADLEDRTIGGLGIYMIKQIMDEVEYKREMEQNILTVSKTIDSQD